MFNHLKKAKREGSVMEINGVVHCHFSSIISSKRASENVVTTSKPLARQCMLLRSVWSKKQGTVLQIANLELTNPSPIWEMSFCSSAVSISRTHCGPCSLGYSPVMMSHTVQSVTYCRCPVLWAGSLAQSAKERRCRDTSLWPKKLVTHSLAFNLLYSQKWETLFFNLGSLPFIESEIQSYFTCWCT